MPEKISLYRRLQDQALLGVEIDETLAEALDGVFEEIARGHSLRLARLQRRLGRLAIDCNGLRRMEPPLKISYLFNELGLGNSGMLG